MLKIDTGVHDCDSDLRQIAFGADFGQQPFLIGIHVHVIRHVAPGSVVIIQKRKLILRTCRFIGGHLINAVRLHIHHTVQRIIFQIGGIGIRGGCKLQNMQITETADDRDGIFRIHRLCGLYDQTAGSEGFRFFCNRKQFRSSTICGSVLDHVVHVLAESQKGIGIMRLLLCRSKRIGRNCRKNQCQGQDSR